jgi:hypothetical protein
MAIVTVHVEDLRAPATTAVLGAVVNRLGDEIGCPVASGATQIHEIRSYVWTSFSCSICESRLWLKLTKAKATDSSNLWLHANLALATPLDSKEKFRDQVLLLAYRLSLVPPMIPPLEPSSMRCGFEHGNGTFNPKIEAANGRWSGTWRCQECGTSLSVSAC